MFAKTSDRELEPLSIDHASHRYLRALRGDDGEGDDGDGIEGHAHFFLMPRSTVASQPLHTAPSDENRSFEIISAGLSAFRLGRTGPNPRAETTDPPRPPRGDCDCRKEPA